jgi:hypothetical protein
MNDAFVARLVLLSFALCFGSSKALLVISMPHSSSTATAVQLSLATTLEVQQAFVCFDDGTNALAEANITGEVTLYNTSSDFWPLAMHSDCCEHDARTLERWITDRKIIFKQHLPPSRRHVSIIKQHLDAGELVVLLSRNPYNAAHGYCERILKEKEANIARLESVASRKLESEELSLLKLKALIAWLTGECTEIAPDSLHKY